MAKEALRNILTFGADGRVARRFEEYVPLVVQLAEAEASAQGMRSEVAAALERLQGTKREAVEWLKRLALEDMPDDARAAFAHAEVPAEDDVPSITVTRPLSSADVGVHLSGPLGAVASAAAGLVGTIGVSGAGAASATATVLGSEVLAKALAWLGVSAATPAAGAPLSVIAVAAVVAQAVGAAAVSCHRDAAAQIGKIEKATASAEADLTKLRSVASWLTDVARRADALDLALRQQAGLCTNELALAKERLGRRFWFGHLIEWVRRKLAALMRRPYRDPALRPVVESAWKLHGMVNVKVTESQAPNMA